MRCAPCSPWWIILAVPRYRFESWLAGMTFPNGFWSRSCLNSRAKVGWTAWRECAADTCSQGIPVRSRWARWCATLTGLSRRLIVFQSQVTSGVHRNQSAGFGGFFSMRAITSLNLWIAPLSPKSPSARHCQNTRFRPVLLAEKEFKFFQKIVDKIFFRVKIRPIESLFMFDLNLRFLVAVGLNGRRDCAS